MSKTMRPILFTIEPVKPRNRVAVEGLKRRGGPHVKPYGGIRQRNKRALAQLVFDETHLEN
jgi:hypothetical protein